jgi:hypothetical protein
MQLELCADWNTLYLFQSGQYLLQSTEYKVRKRRTLTGAIFLIWPISALDQVPIQLPISPRCGVG